MKLHIAPPRVCTSLHGRSPDRKKVARPPKVRPGVTVRLVVAITLHDLSTCRLIVMVVITMNLRELQQQKRAVTLDAIVKERRPVGCVSPSWLACYSTFQDALQSGETNFRALPHCAKLSVLKRIATGADSPTVTAAVLNEVRVAYVELATTSVAEAIEGYLSAGTNSKNLQNITNSSPVLEVLAAQFPPMCLPSVARPPCLVSPGNGIFLNGWARFLMYWSRNDKTIPLLAVDWPVLYERLTGNRPEDGKAATNLPR